MSQTHYIFVDCENVHVTPADIALLQDKQAHVTLILGLKHKSLPINTVKRLLQHAGQVELVESKAPGKNALDMILISHLGIRGRMDPEGVFHIIAKDQDYKPVVAHFRDKGWPVFQHDSMAKVPVLKSVKKSDLPPEKGSLLGRLCEGYRTKTVSQAKTRRALQSQIQSSFSPKVSDEDAQAIIQGLVDLGVIVITANDKVEFAKPDAADVSPKAILCLATSAS